MGTDEPVQLSKVSLQTMPITAETLVSKAKRAYHGPTLIVFGNISELTQGGGPNPTSDAGGFS